MVFFRDAILPRERYDMIIPNSRMLCPSFTIWFLLTIEFLVSTFLFILVAILKVFKSLLPKPPRDLTESVVLVAGAASSLSESLASEFARNGCSVVCLDNDHKLIEATASRLKKQRLVVEEVAPSHRKDDSSRCRSTISTYRCNFSDKDAIKRTAEKVKDDVGRIDILVTCIDSINEDAFDTTSKILMSHFWTVLAFFPMMLGRKQAHIIGVTPVALNNDTYQTSKMVIMSFIECMCQELSNHSSNLTFLAFSPIAECSTLKESEERVAKNIVTAVRSDQYNTSWISRLLYQISCMIYNGITLLTEWSHFQRCNYPT
ncbi:retinol dehydrogenase 10-A-like isoform X3 [Frieseomelitta varia]|uniref:retinol dehydrogenase 10-A-like isoform X3 n=1 Tax=Frieseomelitta varia TaxID=561572 RepID=UPI001CB67A7A|nr:retinol dehydrogenase 10-A-like isoform X3 [Frieseomelitta varia]